MHGAPRRAPQTGTRPCRLADGVTLIHEPWIKPFYRCNMWHVRGRDRDLLFDTGLGHFSLRAPCAAGHRARRSPASRATPISTTSAATMNSAHCCVHAPRPQILADPRNDRTLADRYATDEMFDRLPEGWDQSALSREARHRGPHPASMATSSISATAPSRSSTRPAIRPAASACSRRRRASSSPATSSMTGR